MKSSCYNSYRPQSPNLTLMTQNQIDFPHEVVFVTGCKWQNGENAQSFLVNRGMFLLYVKKNTYYDLLTSFAALIHFEFFFFQNV